MEDIVIKNYWRRLRGLNFEHFQQAQNSLHTRAYEFALQHVKEALSCHPKISKNMANEVMQKAHDIRESWDDCREIFTYECSLETILLEAVEKKYGVSK